MRQFFLFNIRYFHTIQGENESDFYRTNGGIYELLLMKERKFFAYTQIIDSIENELMFSKCYNGFLATAFKQIPEHSHPWLHCVQGYI